MAQTGLRRLLISYYIAMGLVLGLFLILAPRDGSLDATISTVLILFILLYPVVFIYTRRYALHIFLFLIAFISGFYGFYHHSVDNHSISNALYFTFRLYLLDFADVFTQDGSSPTQYPILLEIARWTAASYTITTIFIAMYRSLEQRILLFFAQFFGGHHIIFSYNPKSHALIQNLKANHQRVVVVDQAFSDEEKDILIGMKVLLVQASDIDVPLFKRIGIQKARSISLFHLKDRESLYVLMKLEEFSKKKRQTWRLKKLLIHVEAEKFKAELKSFLANVEYFSLPVKIINVYDAIAEKFWQEHQSEYKPLNNFNLLIVGYNTLGNAIVKSAEQFKVKNNKTMRMTVLDSKELVFKSENIHARIFNAEDDELADIIKGHAEDFTHIFVCLDEDYIDLMEGVQLSDMLPTTPVYMNFTDESIAQMFTVVTTETAQTLYSLGTISDVLTQENLEI